jgi:putative transposase
LDKTHKLSIRKQCKILKLNRSSIYYKRKEESKLNLELMRLMDEHYLKHPYKGARRMHTWLTKDKGYSVNIKRINRLYANVLGLRSVLPSPKTTKAGKGLTHKIVPYLLRGLEIQRSNQVWATDITYIPVQGGFMYLTAIIDLYSRFVVGWSLSNNMTSDWCKKMLDQAVEKYGKPAILNSDQGSQYTAELFRTAVAGHQIKQSMDGKGRCIDNVFIERLWWSVKYEDAYIYEYENGQQLYEGMQAYFEKYNNQRRHSSIGDEKPSNLYFSSKSTQSPCEGGLEEKYLSYNYKLA